MKKYRAIAKMQTILYLDFEAKDDDKAFQIAKDADGGDFTEIPNSGSWEIYSINESKRE